MFAIGALGSVIFAAMAINTFEKLGSSETTPDAGLRVYMLLSVVTVAFLISFIGSLLGIFTPKKWVVIMDSGIIIGGTGFIFTIAFIFWEIPVGVAMGLVGLAGCSFIIGIEGSISIGATTIWNLLNNYTLAVLPLFVFMGNLASHCGLSSRLYRAMRVLIGHRKGGLALATIGASAGFGMISDSSLATTATMSRIAIPEMQEGGYSKKLASGSVAAGAHWGY